MTVLTTTTGLLYKLTFTWCGTRDGLTVSNLRFAYTALYLKLTLHAVDDNLKVKLTHSRNNGLSCIFISFHDKGRVFVGEPREGQGHLVLVSYRFGLHSHWNDRLREKWWFEHDLETLLAKSITRLNIFETNDCGYVPCVTSLNIFVLVSMHFNKTTNTLFLASTWVIYHVTLGNHARVNTEEDQLTNILVSP